LKKTDFILTWLKENLSDKRYNHSLGCAETCENLAKRYNIDTKEAYLAGLIHDCAKNFDNDKLLDIIKNQIKTGYDETELKNPKTFHAIVGAYFAKEIFEIEDEKIISAIRKHTIGDNNMSVFDKIVFLSDKIEPNTRDEKYSKKILKIIETNKGVIGLDLALFKCFSETIKNLVKKKLYICPTTINVYNSLQESIGELLDDD